jgi:hypothetical protein
MMFALNRTLALLILSAVPAGAESISPLQTADLSARVHAAGVVAGDPLILATAAKLRKDAGLNDLPLSADAILAEAEALALGDPAVLAQIGDIRGETTKGVASGPIHHLAALPAGATETRPNMPFRGGEYAEVYVEAAPGTDLNLTILDAAGLVVCADQAPSHIAYCGWTPAADGDFTVKIENAGPQPADYAMMTN